MSAGTPSASGARFAVRVSLLFAAICGRHRHQPALPAGVARLGGPERARDRHHHRRAAVRARRGDAGHRVCRRPGRRPPPVPDRARVGGPRRAAGCWRSRAASGRSSLWTLRVLARPGRTIMPLTETVAMSGREGRRPRLRPHAAVGLARASSPPASAAAGWWSALGARVRHLAGRRRRRADGGGRARRCSAADRARPPEGRDQSAAPVAWPTRSACCARACS